ncbi:hypothetical protein FRB98_009680, partial [Tulasnella sp. 332]
MTTNRARRPNRRHDSPPAENVRMSHIISTPLPKFTYEECLQAAKDRLAYPGDLKLRLPAPFVVAGVEDHAVALPPEPKPEKLGMVFSNSKKRKQEKQGRRQKALDFVDEEYLRTAHIPISNLDFLPPKQDRDTDGMRPRLHVRKTTRANEIGLRKSAPGLEVSVLSSPSPPPIHPAARQDRPVFIHDDIEYTDRDSPPPRFASEPAVTAIPSRENQAQPPHEELVEIMSQLSFGDGSASYRALQQSIGSPIPFIRRNLRRGIEAKMVQEHPVDAHSRGAPVPVRSAYTLERALQEESSVATSRRARSLRFIFSAILAAPPQPYVAPGSCMLTAHIFLVSLTPRTTAPYKFPIGQQLLNLQEAADIDLATNTISMWGGSATLESEEMFVRLKPEGFTWKGAQLVITLSHFRDDQGRPAVWAHRQRRTRTPSRERGARGYAIVGATAATVRYMIVDVQGAFLKAMEKRSTMTWVRRLNSTDEDDPQKMSTMTESPVTLSLDWRFHPSYRLLSPLPPAIAALRDSDKEILVEVRFEDHVWRTRQLGWRCPLCCRFGGFSDAGHLRFHIKSDHPRITFELVQAGVSQKIVIGPNTEPEADPRFTPLHRDAAGNVRKLAAKHQHEMEDDDCDDYDDEEKRRRDGSVEGSSLLFGSDLEDSLKDQEDADVVETKLVVETDVETPPPPPTFIPPNDAIEISSDEEEPPAQRERVEIDLTRDESPRPQPYDARGPSGKPPSRSRTTRIEPTLMDLLDELSMDDFGNQRSKILATEEHLLDLPNLTIEAKVMWALWNRWIILNSQYYALNCNINSVRSHATPIPEPSPFTGGTLADYHKFIISIRKYARVQGRLRDNDWIADYVACCLDGEALSWHLQLTSEVAEDWLKLQRALVEHYSSHDTTETPTPHLGARPLTRLPELRSRTTSPEAPPLPGYAFRERTPETFGGARFGYIEIRSNFLSQPAYFNGSMPPGITTHFDAKASFRYPASHAPGTILIM